MKIRNPYAVDPMQEFEVVEQALVGYSVWNIGNNAPAGYVALAKRIPGTEAWQECIDPDTAIAVKSPKWREIMRYAAFVATPKVARENANRPGIAELIPEIDKIFGGVI